MTNSEKQKPECRNSECRDDAWLAGRVRLLREQHFADVPQGYPITVRFGTRARNRFGSIAARNGQTLILINRLFAHPDVPTYVVDGTLAHELAHYAHGFGSGLSRLHRDAHRGGVVDRELERRGLAEVSAKAEQWRKACWDAFYESHCVDLTQRAAARRDADRARWDAFIGRPECRSEAELRERLAELASRLQPFCTRESPPFELEWLRATNRQTAPSYWYPRERVLRIHGLLADRRVPDEVIEIELACWLVRLATGAKWQAVQAILHRAGMGSQTDSALTWRSRRWNAFRKAGCRV